MAVTSSVAASGGILDAPEVVWKDAIVWDNGNDSWRLHEQEHWGSPNVQSESDILEPWIDISASGFTHIEHEHEHLNEASPHLTQLPDLPSPLPLPQLELPDPSSLSSSASTLSPSLIPSLSPFLSSPPSSTLRPATQRQRQRSSICDRTAQARGSDATVR